jgi:hypothetical protein
VDGVEAGVWVVRLRRVGCDPEGPGEKGETRVGHKRIHHIKAPGFGYHFRFRVVTRLWSYTPMVRKTFQNVGWEGRRSNAVVFRNFFKPQTKKNGTVFKKNNFLMLFLVASQTLNNKKNKIDNVLIVFYCFDE